MRINDAHARPYDNVTCQSSEPSSFINTQMIKSFFNVANDKQKQE